MFLAFHGMNHYTGPRESACTLATLGSVCVYVFSRLPSRISIPRDASREPAHVYTYGSSSPARELWLRPYFWLNHPAKYGCVILGGTMSMPARILPAAEIGATMGNPTTTMTHHRFLFRLPFFSLSFSKISFERWKINMEIKRGGERERISNATDRGFARTMIQTRDIPDDAWRHISDSSALPLRAARN